MLKRRGGKMATKADFTEEEWATLEKGVTGAGFLMAISDRGFFDTFKEAGALARHLRDARENTSSELVREFAETRSTGFGIGDSPPEVESETLDALRAAIRTLEAKSREDVDAYRAFVIEVAESVGSAAKGGEAAEAATLDKIRSALDVG
jgi:hypothetical protein